MDALGISQPIVIQTAPSSNTAPVLPKPEAPVLPVANNDTGNFNQQDAEQQRFAAVQRVSQQVSDIYIVSDKTFTIFKDVSGQYVTRFTSLRDGKITYVPEPNLFRLGGENDHPVLKIKV